MTSNQQIYPEISSTDKEKLINKTKEETLVESDIESNRRYSTFKADNT